MPRGDKSAYTDKQKRQSEHIEEGYEQRGKRDQPCDDEALLYLQAWLAKNYGADEGATNLPDPVSLGDKLAAQPGCDDPLLLTAIAAESLELREKIAALLVLQVDPR